MNSQFAKFGIAAVVALGLSSGVFAQADNTNSKVAPATSFPGWMTDYSKANQGRISRDAYMEESARRWDAMDKERRGLTVDQVYTLYGYPSPGAMPSPKDNMTSPANPGNVKK